MGVFLLINISIFVSLVVRVVVRIGVDPSLNNPYTRVESILQNFNNRRCTEPGDKFYGMIGLTRGVGLAQHFDHSEPLETIYYKLFVDMLRYTGSTNVLFYACRTTSFGNNSLFWIVNWRKTVVNGGSWLDGRFRRVVDKDAEEYDGASKSKLYSAQFQEPTAQGEFMI